MAFFNLILVSLVSAHHGDNCKYSCTYGGGCETLYTGPRRTGHTKGSCFPSSLGAFCSGTPKECSDCKTKITCDSDGEQISNGMDGYIKQIGPGSVCMVANQTATCVCPETKESTCKKVPLGNNEDGGITSGKRGKLNITTIIKSSLKNPLKDDFRATKTVLNQLLKLENWTFGEKETLNDLESLIQNLFHYHIVLEKEISEDQVDKDRDCTGSCRVLKENPWLKIARRRRSVGSSNFRIRRQDGLSDDLEGTDRQRILEENDKDANDLNIKVEESAVDEADDSFLRVQTLLENYKDSLTRRSKCDKGKEDVFKELKIEARNLDEQLKAARLSVEKFFDEEIKTISVQGRNDLSWKFKKCDLIWGREFTGSAGEMRNIIEEDAKSVHECEKACQEYDCVCWSYKNGVCGLKDAYHCEKLSDVWSIETVSVIALTCLHRVEVCSNVTNNCDWKPARVIDEGKCTENKGEKLADGDNITVEEPEDEDKEDAHNNDEEESKVEKSDFVCNQCKKSSPEECGILCGQNIRCRAWGFLKNTNECWLKGSDKIDKENINLSYSWGPPCKNEGILRQLENFVNSNAISKEDFEYVKTAVESNPWEGEEGHAHLVLLNRFRFGNVEERKVLQPKFDQMYENLTNQQKAEVFRNIQSDIEVDWTRFESLEHDNIYEPDPDDETVCTNNENPSECQNTGSTNSNIRKKHREFRDIFLLGSTNAELKDDSKELMSGAGNLISDIPVSDMDLRSVQTIAKETMERITDIEDVNERERELKKFENDFIKKSSKNACCYQTDKEVRNKIKSFAKSVRLFGKADDNQEKALNQLETTTALSDADKEALRDYLKADAGERKEQREKAKKKLEQVQAQRKKRGSQFGKNAVNKVKRLTGYEQNSSNDPGKKPKHRRKSFARTFRQSSTVSKLNALQNGLNSLKGAKAAFESGGGIDQATAVIDIVASISAFAGPYGAAFSAALGVVNTFISFLIPPGPSQTDVMTALINDQTDVIVGKIDEQTEIFLKALEKLDAKITKSIFDAVEQNSWREMIHEMKGATNSLTVKMKHLDEYKFTCILEWPEIAFEADIQAITRSMGKVGSFMTYYCFSRANMVFCGDMVYQYIMLANLRNNLRAASISIVSNSDIHNQDNKKKGLLGEHKTAVKYDSETLTKILFMNDIKDPEFKYLCFATCAFHEVQDDYINENIDGVPDMKLGKGRKTFINHYLSMLGLPKRIEDTKVCRTCFKDTPCKEGFERGSKSKVCVKPSDTRSTETVWSPFHDGSLHFLENIPMECRENEALTKFRLHRDSGRSGDSSDRLKYQYSCGTSVDRNMEITRVVEKGDEWFSRPKGVKPTYNWRFSTPLPKIGWVGCTDPGNAIAGIRLKRNDDNKVWWEIKCAKIPYTMTFKEHNTGCNSDGYSDGYHDYIQYLDRHPINCEERGFLRRFKITFDACSKKHQWRFDYTCGYNS